MAPITWRNINTPNFTGVNVALRGAANSGQNAFNILQSVLQDRQKVQDNNYANQGRLNTEEEIANIQKLQSLANLNEQVDNFDLGSLRERSGANVNIQQVLDTLNQQKGKLRNEAVDLASLAGRTAAQEGNSVITGTDAFRDKLLSLGASESFASDATNDFNQNDLNIFKQRSAEDNKIKTTQFLSEYQGKNLLGVDPSTIEREAIERFGPQFDVSGIRSGISNIIGNQTNAQTQRLNSQRIQDEASFNKAVNVGMDALLKTGDINSAFTSIQNSNLKGTDRLKAISGLQNLYNSKAQLNPIQQQEIAGIQDVATRVSQQRLGEIQSEAANIKLNLDALNPLEAGLEEQVTTYRNKNIEGVIANLAQGSDWDSKATETMRGITSEYADKLPPGVNKLILIQTLQDRGGGRRSGFLWGNNKDIDTLTDNENGYEAFKQAYRQNAKRYLTYQKEKVSASEKIATLTKKSQRINDAVQVGVDSFKRKYTKGNLQNQVYSVTQEDLQELTKAINSVN